jgi:membrane carboxypeptidase/penicillin-binding protein
MRVALDGMPDRELPRPPGIVELRIVPETGLVAAECRRDFVTENFLVESQPEREPETSCLSAAPLTVSPDADGDPANAAQPGSGSDRLFE